MVTELVMHVAALSFAASEPAVLQASEVVGDIGLSQAGCAGYIPTQRGPQSEHRNGACASKYESISKKPGTTAGTKDSKC